MEAKNKENTICTVFSHRMSQLLEANKKSRKDVCRDLDIKYTTFCDWINGRNIPKAPQIERLCDYFGVEPAYFFIETEPGNASERFATRVSAYAKAFQQNEAVERDRMERAEIMLKDGALSLDRIAEYTSLPLDKVKELADLCKNHKEFI